MIETAINKYGHSSRARLQPDTDEGFCFMGLRVTMTDAKARTNLPQGKCGPLNLFFLTVKMVA